MSERVEIVEREMRYLTQSNDNDEDPIYSDKRVKDSEQRGRDSGERTGIPNYLTLYLTQGNDDDEHPTHSDERHRDSDERPKNSIPNPTDSRSNPR